MLTAVRPGSRSHSFFPSPRTIASRRFGDTPARTVLADQLDGPVEVVVDLANLEAGARTIGARLSPDALVSRFSEIPKCRLVIFGAEWSPGDLALRWDPLGAEVIAKPLTHNGLQVKGNLDCEIVIHALEVTRHRAKTVILGSGDADFAALARTLRASGLTLFCFSWSHCLSREFAAACNGTILAGRDLLVSSSTRLEGPPCTSPRT